MITQVSDPGVYPDLDPDVYHGDPVPGGSLSSSGARRLLPPGCPALFAWERENPRQASRAMELGSVAHHLVLGSGEPIDVIDAENYRTKAAQDLRDQARAEGHLPLLVAEYAQVQEMAKAISEHPLASALLCRGDVMAEQSMFWRDVEFGVMLRARLDAVRDSGRLLVTDYKTTASAEPSAFARSVASYGYHQQGDWYLDAARSCLGALDAAFLLIAQEKTPPYLVTVCELDEHALAAGRLLNRKAVRLYAECSASGLWPGYLPGNDIALISLPAWAQPREEYDL